MPWACERRLPIMPPAEAAMPPCACAVAAKLLSMPSALSVLALASAPNWLCRARWIPPASTGEPNFSESIATNDCVGSARLFASSSGCTHPPSVP